ncbi:AAA domain-containing protein [Streptacidiphilus fuscans]|uniref:AAA family ATPase n=1 Tax=Streptacidiphilus fuscans TaxID=2789292 RepID=A0A931B3J9_9ACTN|nr:AAA domain-containing protein [Streptacidiphilus fuscans]MBF9070469.1 AAA family ATPase [Streptacidiphilus fuscans]
MLVRPERSQQPWATADATRLPDGKIRVTTSTDLGPNPSSVLLREDDASNWVVLAERLEAAGQTGSPVDPAKSGQVLGLSTPTLSRAADPDRLVSRWRTLKLNPAQRTAVEQALGSSALFLWGPPGTGKTDVVSHIAEGCYRQGLNLLFLAPTNVAVDQALERICDLLQGESGFEDGLVQRAGDISVASLEQNYGEFVDPVRIAGRMGVQIDAAIVVAQSQLTTVRDELQVHDQAAELTESLSAAWKRNSTAITTMEQAAQAALRLDAEGTALRLKISEIGIPSGLMASRKAARLQELQGQLNSIDQALSDNWHQRNWAEQEESATSALIADLGPRLAALQSTLAGLLPRPRLVERADVLQRELEELDRQRRGLADAVRSRCRVMGTTVAKAVQSRKLLDRVDVVILDEAGMVDLPSAWYVAGLADKRLILAGDFRQLPAITKGSQDRKATEPEREHSRRWAERDAFHAAGLVTASGSARIGDPRMVALNTQYRMHSAICGLVNAVAYPDSPLRTGRSDGSRLPSSPLLEGPLVLVDTSARRIPGRDHKSNVVHEAVIHQLVRGLQYDGVLPGRNWADVPPGERAADRMAVIAPYKDQVKALNQSLAQRFGEQYEGLVDTVHRFQGSQRPLVVIDTVAGAGRSPGYFYSGTGLSSQTCRLLNVALSRAQDHLVVVADTEHLRENLAPHSEVVHMLDHLEQHAIRLPVDDLVPIRAASDLGGLSEDELARPAFFPSDEVQRAVAWDLRQARKSIEVYCAFLDPQPVRYWSSAFRELASRGVQVTVFTRDHSAQPRKAALVEELRAAGCRVEQRERMHEKVLIVDETVLWHGSLNLLCGTGPTDLMMRITDGAACQRVRRIIDRARPERRTGSTRRDGHRGVAEQTTAVTAAGLDSGSNGVPLTVDGPAPGVEIGGRLYLNVPFADKDQAKRELGAQWDRTAKLWWVTPDKRAAAHRWLPIEQ